MLGTYLGHGIDADNVHMVFVKGWATGCSSYIETQLTPRKANHTIHCHNALLTQIVCKAHVLGIFQHVCNIRQLYHKSHLFS